MNDQKKNQVKKMSEDKEQIRDQGGFNDDASQNVDKPKVNDQELESQWERLKEPLHQKYPDLTDDDLRYNRGEFGQMLGRIGQKTGMTGSELRHKLLSWDDTPSTTF